jgi:Protein of unknown function (DUF3532).
MSTGHDRTNETGHEPLATGVAFDGGLMRVGLSDGREIATPLEWFPRLREASPEERAGWRLIGGGVGIHWETIDEDISVEGLLAG